MVLSMVVIMTAMAVRMRVRVAVCAMFVRFAIRVVMVVAQQPRAQEVDAEAEDRDRDRLVESDPHRVNEPTHALITDEKRDQGQNQGARIAGELPELAGPEGKSGVTRMFARVSVCKGRDEKRAGMGRHVQPVGRSEE